MVHIMLVTAITHFFYYYLKLVNQYFMIFYYAKNG